jgi:hypothetical protein
MQKNTKGRAQGPVGRGREIPSDSRPLLDLEGVCEGCTWVVTPITSQGLVACLPSHRPCAFAGKRTPGRTSSPANAISSRFAAWMGSLVAPVVCLALTAASPPPQTPSCASAAHRHLTLVAFLVSSRHSDAAVGCPPAIQLHRLLISLHLAAYRRRTARHVPVKAGVVGGQSHEGQACRCLVARFCTA